MVLKHCAPRSYAIHSIATLKYYQICSEVGKNKAHVRWLKKSYTHKKYQSARSSRSRVTTNVKVLKYQNKYVPEL